MRRVYRDHSGSSDGEELYMERSIRIGLAGKDVGDATHSWRYSPVTASIPAAGQAPSI